MAKAGRVNKLVSDGSINLGFGPHKRKLSRTVPESLREVSGVMVQKTSHGQGSPYMRGFTGFRTLFLVDGIRLNNSVFRDGPNQYASTVDNLSLAGTELIRGPASVLYGSDAPMRDPYPQFGWVTYANICEQDKRNILGRNMERILARVKL